MAIILKSWNTSTSREVGINPDASSIEINGSTLRVKAGGITNDMIIAAAGIPYSKLSIADADLTIAKTSGLQGALDGKSPTSHNHDSAYLGIAATAADSDKLDGQHGSYYSPTTHNHDSAYVSTTLVDGKIIVGSSGNAATAVTPTGDVTISNTGVTAIGADKVSAAMIRLANNTNLRARNAANDADVNILKVNATDVIEFASIPQASGTPSNASDLTNKAYVDQKAITGGVVKEALLINEQKSDSQGILASEVIYFTAAPIENDTVILKNGTNTFTYTYKDSPAGNYEVQTNVSAVTSMQNLSAKIAGNVSTDDYNAIFTADGLDSINSTGVVVVYEKATAAGVSTSRIYGVWGTQASAKVVEYNGQTQYTTSKAAIEMPSSDPAAVRFGLRKQVSALENGEIHLDYATDVLQEWNSDASVWYNLSGSGSLPDATSASGGGTKGKVTFDSDFGLTVASGVAKVNLTSSGGLKFTTGTLGADVGTGSTQVVAGNHNHDSAYLGIAATAADSDKLDGQHGSYYATQTTADGKQNIAKTITNGQGTTISVTQLCYIKADGNAALAKADAAATSEVAIIVKDATIADATPGSFFTAGQIVGGFTSLTPGKVQYLSAATAGAMTETAPSATGNVVFKIGTAVSTTEIEFNPEHIIDIP